MVLPPPYMVESLQNGHVDAFCVGAPWNSVAVDLGIGHILHFVSEILTRAAEKLLGRAPALGRRASGAGDAPGARASARRRFRRGREQSRRSRGLLAAPNRIGVAAEVIRRTLDGRLKVSPDGAIRTDPRYLLVGRAGAARPDPAQAAWLYAQMVRWGQAPLSREMLAPQRRCSGPTFTMPRSARPRRCPAGEPADGIGAFAGPPFDPDNIEAHLAAWTIKRAPAGLSTTHWPARFPSGCDHARLRAPDQGGCSRRWGERWTSFRSIRRPRAIRISPALPAFRAHNSSPSGGTRAPRTSRAAVRRERGCRAAASSISLCRKRPAPSGNCRPSSRRASALPSHGSSNCPARRRS